VDRFGREKYVSAVSEKILIGEGMEYGESASYKSMNQKGKHEPVALGRGEGSACGIGCLWVKGRKFLNMRIRETWDDRARRSRKSIVRDQVFLVKKLKSKERLESWDTFRRRPKCEYIRRGD